MNVRSFRLAVCSAVALFATLVAPFTVAPVRAQQGAADVAVVSLAPLDRLLSDTRYLLEACNIPEMGGLVNMTLAHYTQGLDKTKPIGASVTMGAAGPSAVVFVPVVDASQFFGALAGMGIEPDDLGDGLYEINTGGQLIFAKNANGWLFVADSEAALAETPADPSAMLGNLPRNYNFAIRINAENIPQGLKDQALEQLRQGFERGMAEQGGQTEAEKAAAQEMGEASIEQFRQMIMDTQQVVLGWAIDKEEQRTYVDSGIQFKEGSKLAAQAEMANDVTSDFTAFVLPNSSASFRFTSVIAEEDRAVAKNSIRNSISQAKNQIAQQNMPEEAQQLLNQLIDGLFSIMEKTIDEGKFDGAGSVSVADDTLRVLVGGHIADGNALADELKQAASQLPDAANVPTFEFDYETYNGIALHRVSGPLKIADPAARRIFGDTLVLTIGTGEKSYFIALDPTGDAVVKSVIDQMQSATGVKSSPFDGVVELQSILRYAQTIAPNPFVDNAVNTLSGYVGKDKVQVSSRLIPRGGLYRLSIEEGVLRAVGAAAKSGNGGGGGF